VTVGVGVHVERAPVRTMARWALRSLLTTLVACAVSSSFISADDLAAVGGGAALAAVIPGASAMGSCGPDDKTCKSNHTSDVNGYVDCKACVASGLGWSPVQVHPRPLRC